MESTRWLRLAPLALAVVAGAVGIGRPMAGAAGDPPWEPPPCPDGEAAGPPGAAAWYQLDPVLDRQGTLGSMRLTVGVAGGPVRWLSLTAESFASGPVGGRILAGTDDGAATRLSLVDPARGCVSAVADEGAVIRSAVLAPDGRAIYEHRVDRTTRADLGVWLRPIGPDGKATGNPARILPGLTADTVTGRTFSTELLIAADGRLVVSSCGIEACRDRVVDPATGAVTAAAGVGPAVGLDGRRLVARSVCAGDPCDIVAVDLATGTREVVAEAAFAAAMDGGTLVYEQAGGRVATLELATGHRSGPVDGGGVPIHRGSLAAAGADVPAGTVALGPGGRATAAGTRALDVLRLTTTTLEEVRR